MSERLDRLGMFRLIADKIERDPSLLQIGLENIERWIANGIDQQHKLLEWRERILAAKNSEEEMQVLLGMLRSDDEPAEYEREFSPFAGVLNPEEVAEFFDQCAYVH